MKTLLKIIYTALGLCIACPHLHAQQVTLTIIANQGGTVTSTAPGTYPIGAGASINVQADSEHYISGLDIQNLSFDNYIKEVDIIALQARIDGTTPDYSIITSDAESFTLNSDTTVTVSFGPLSPTITEQPTDQISLTGSNVTLATAAVGRTPFAYQWQENGGNILNATNATLTLNSVTATNDGIYSCTITNAYGLTNTQPASLLVDDFIVFSNAQPVTNTAITVDGATYFGLQSLFPNGQIFYTLDGSEPDFNATPYNNSNGLYGFGVNNSCTLRAIAYSEDFSQSVSVGPIAITVIPIFPVVVYSFGGGSAAVNSNGNYGTFESNSVATITATPDTGWTFMGWNSGSSFAPGPPTTNVVVDQLISLYAVFGTTVNTTTIGNGSVIMQPALTLYPYGSVVTLTAVPQNGNYFGLWGNAVSGKDNPINFPINAPTQTVSALFSPLPSGFTTLTVLSDPDGYVQVNPSTNRYPVGTSVTLTAVPYTQFTGWTGDFVGTNTQISIVMDTNKVLTAHFSGSAWLNIATVNNSAQLQLSAYDGTYQIQTSTNLLDWQPLCIVTNYTGNMQLSEPISPNVPFLMYRAVLQ